jgi:hypothetical protein
MKSIATSSRHIISLAVFTTLSVCIAVLGCYGRSISLLMDAVALFISGIFFYRNPARMVSWNGIIGQDMPPLSSRSKSLIFIAAFLFMASGLFVWIRF